MPHQQISISDRGNCTRILPKIEFFIWGGFNHQSSSDFLGHMGVRIQFTPLVGWDLVELSQQLNFYTHQHTLSVQYSRITTPQRTVQYCGKDDDIYVYIRIYGAQMPDSAKSRPTRGVNWILTPHVRPIHWRLHGYQDLSDIATTQARYPKRAR